MNKPNTTVVTLLKQATFVLFASAGMALALDFALDASEAEDCWRFRRQHDAGYPVTVPDWCEGK